MTGRRAAARVVAAVAAVLLALALAACSDDDGSGASTAAPPATTATTTFPTTTAPATTAVSVFMPRGDPGPDCDDVRAVPRTVPAPAVLHGAIAALLEGPTAAERQQGYGGWFGPGTAGSLRSARIREGIAYIDLADLRNAIPNASTSCGSALLLAQLDGTATQFGTVRRAVYSFDGDVAAFYEWLQREAPPG
jgi:hypothetical protein